MLFLTFFNLNRRLMGGVCFFCFAIVLLAFAGIGSMSLAANDRHAMTEQEEGASIRQLRSNLKAFMKNSKRDDAPELQHAAILNLCQLHWELVTHPRFQTSQAIQGMRVVAANRLKQYAKMVRRKKLREEQSKKKNGESSGANDSSSGFTSFDDFRKSSIATENAASLLVERTYGAMGAVGGGPTGWMAYATGSMGPPADNGEALVALIENTINPEFWQKHGGPGRIHYYRPLRVLVISASAQVHQDTLDLLLKLRQAGQ